MDTVSLPINEIDNVKDISISGTANLPMDTGGDTVSEEIRKNKNNRSGNYFKNVSKEKLKEILNKSSKRCAEIKAEERLRKMLALKDTEKVISLTDEEKKNGLTYERKMQFVKEIAPALRAKNADEFFAEHIKTLIEIKERIHYLEHELKDKGFAGVRIIPLLMQYADREFRFGEMKFKLNSIQNKPMSVDFVRLRSAWNTINSKNGELKEKEMEIRLK
jgi:hypothetical protein